MANASRQHPLHSIEFIVSTLSATGEHPGQRRTGRSTAQALRLLSEAIRQPGIVMLVKDHHGTVNADRNLVQRMREIVELLHLEEITFRMDVPSVCFGKEI